MSAGCAVSTPPRVMTVGAAPAALVSLGFDATGPAGESDSPRYAAFQGLLKSALELRGVAINPASTNRLAIALAQRPAGLGIRSAQSASGDWLSIPRKHHFYDACRAVRIEAVMVLRDAVTGTVTARWRGGFDACRVEDSDLAALAEEFARALTGR